jgi:DNA polymerase-1
VIERVKVGGEPVRLIALPAFTRKAAEAWERFTRSDPDGIYGLDVESTVGEGMGTYSPTVRMRLIQFGNDHEAWALDPTHPGWRKRIVRFLSDPARRFVSHNAAFDSTRVLFEFGIELGDRSLDTLPMAALLWPGRTAPGGMGRRGLCAVRIDPGLSDADRMREARFTDLFFANKPRKGRLLPLSFEPGVSPCRKPRSKGKDKCTEVSFEGSLVGYCYDHWLARKGTKESEAWGWEHIALDDPIYCRYAGLDAVYVRRLLDILARLVKEARMGRLSRTEQQVKRCMTNYISVPGLRVDAEWTSDVLAEVGLEFEEAENEVLGLTGLKARSPKMREWLADRGVYADSLDKDHLPDLVEKYGHGSGFGDATVGDVLDDLVTVSKHSNLLTNLRTILKHATEGDGFVHPNVNTQQAHTGRMSITDPAMQTLAKKGLKGERLRGCFIAREGKVFVGGDYDSQEIRIAAALSRDPALLRIVNEGLNQHVLTAESLFPTWTTKDECPDEYGAAKILDFAQQYGAMPRKIAATLTAAGIPTTPAEAKVLWQKWRDTYAGLVAWSDEMARLPKVRNPFGRVIPRDPFRDYANGNYMIQSTGRDVLGQAICNLDDQGYGEWLWLPIHDELVLEVDEDDAETACRILGDCMTMTVKGVEIPAEGEVVGTRWRGLT